MSNSYILPGSGTFQDATGNVYSIDSTGRALENGSPIAGGSGTGAMEYYNGSIFGQDATSQQWYSWNQATWTPVAPPPAVGSSPAGSGGTPTSSPGPQPTSGAFQVSGGQILGPNGQPFTARGINIYADDNTANVLANGAGTASSIVNTFPGINFVRLEAFNLNTDTASALKPFVQTLTSQGIVVEIEDHNYPTVLSGSNLNTAANWYSNLATAFKGNPYVWFGTQNEPDLSQGPGAVDKEISTIYNAVRSTGNDTITMIDPAGGYTTNGMDPSTFSGMNNAVWDVHFYNWITNYSADLNANVQALANEISGAQSFATDANGTMPVIVGEYGIATGAAPDPGGMQVVQAVEQSGYGSAAFAWTSGDPNLPLLLNDPWGDPSKGLSQYGQTVAQFIAAGANSASGPTAGSASTSGASNTSGSGRGTGTTSPQGNDYITAASGSFQDAVGNTYTIDAAGTAQENGMPIPGGGNTAAMEYANATVYGQDAATSQWYTWDQSTWTSASAPPPVSSTDGAATTSPGSATQGGGSTTNNAATPQTIDYIAAGSGSLQDAAGNTYGIDAAGNAQENGSPIPGGSGTAAIVDDNGTILGLDARSGQWYAWDQTSWTPSAPDSSGATLLVSQGNATITTGAGDDTIRFAGTGNVINAGGGANVLYDSGSSSTIVIPAAGSGSDVMHGNVLQNGDVFDLRSLLSATDWNGNQSTLSQYLSVETSGGSTTLLATDTAHSTAHAVATFDGSGQVALSTILSHAIV